MFHLITSYTAWGEHSGTVRTSRLNIDANNPSTSHLISNQEPVLEQIRKYPALLVQEPQVPNPQPARVAHINSIQKVGSDYTIQYFLDPELSPIPSDVIVNLLIEIGVREMSLNTSCWRVIEYDLFKMLLRNNQRHVMTPSVFNFDAYYRQDPRLVSVMMPFDAGFKPIYAAITAGVNAAGFECRRADDIWINQHIIQDIVDLIASAKVVICDLTGKNPNVLYEAGIAHSLGKEIILLTQSMEDVPFDLRSIRCLPYLNNGEGLQKLHEQIRQKLDSLGILVIN